MMNKKNSCNYFNLIIRPKQWIVVFLLLIMMTKPAMNFITILTESKYELFENIAQENTEEKKENISDDEKIHHTVNFNTHLFSILTFSYFGIKNIFLSFKPDIQLPPPR